MESGDFIGGSPLVVSLVEAINARSPRIIDGWQKTGRGIPHVVLLSSDAEVYVFTGAYDSDTIINTPLFDCIVSAKYGKIHLDDEAGPAFIEALASQHVYDDVGALDDCIEQQLERDKKAQASRILNLENTAAQQAEIIEQKQMEIDCLNAEVARLRSDIANMWNKFNDIIWS